MECPEVLERGRNFRLLAADELPQLLDILATYLPESLKVSVFTVHRYGAFRIFPNRTVVERYICVQRSIVLRSTITL